MKKLFRLFIILAMLVLSVFNVYAADDHVYITDYEDFITQKQYDDLNEDLDHIRDDYDIDIYFIYDTSITNSEDGVKRYAESFVDSHRGASNTVAIVMSESSYYVAARGNASDDVLNRSDVIWNRFYSRASNISSSDPNAFYEGIVNCYQYVVKLVNEKNYQSDAPVSVMKALVNDYADLLSDSEEEKLNRKLQRIKDNYGFDTVIVTTNSLNGMKASDYADDFYDYSQYGEDGLLFLLDMGSRTWYVSTKGKAADYFTDYGIDEIVDEMMGDLGDAKYYDAFITFSNRVAEYIISGNKGDIIDVDGPGEKKKEKFGIFNVAISALLGFFSSLITTLSMKSGMRSVSRQHYARNYIVNNSFYLNGASDMLVNRHVTRTPRPRRDDSFHSSGPSSSGGGGSHMHTSSSGSSHGGHGGHF